MANETAADWDEPNEDRAGDGAPDRPVVERWMVLGVVTLAIFLRGRAAEEMQTLNRDPQGYRQIAEALTRHGVYGLFLFTSKPIPTAYRPPIYPLLLAPSVVLREGAPLAVAMLHLLFGALTVWLVWRLGCRWGMPLRAALLASGLIAVDPILLNRSGQIVSETLATLLAVVALHALTSFSDRPTWRRAGLAGACLGLGILCQPTYLAWLACTVALLPAALGQMLPWRIRWSQACACLLGAAAVLAPWVVRNQMQFGVPIVTTTHGGYALLLGNNPSVYDHLRSGAWGSDWDPREFNATWLGEQQTVGADEVSRDRLAYALAWQNIRDEPSMFLLSSVARVGSLWGLVPSRVTPFEGHRARFLRYATGVWYALEFMLAALGVFELGRRIARTPWLWGTLLVVSFTAAQATFSGSLYERAPLAPVLTLLAATGARELWAGRRPIKLAS